jgi:hypothetical protein
MGISRACCITVILICASASVFGQIGSSSLSGTVTDPSGAVVPNAIVTLTSAEQSVTRTTETGPEGVYVIPTLAPGRYQVKVTANGFVEQQTQPFELSSGQAGSLNVALRVAGQASQVTVEETAPLLQTTSASLGATVTARQVADLPLLAAAF